ncbi:GNVR domain-containing protein [Caloramator sp. mosi_1]|nr:GNVR domain-containing protein [Caloramator sp. mosi_1]WDC85912.1 GNVR domain-containing protein [Caloramator sp. mosi_1]
MGEVKKFNNEEENIQIIDTARVVKKKVENKTLINIIIAFVLGIMISLGLIFVLEYIDNTVKTEKEIEDVLGLQVLGIIPHHNE